jgi:uncharacterized protein (TIGR01370 family)
MPQTGMYVLQGINPAAVAVAPFDVKAIDIYNDNSQLFSAAQVQQMGGGAGNGLLLGYFSIGEAENYRDYFKTIPSSALGPVNPDWPGDYQVAYWTSEWQTVATAYVDQMIKLGYDGVFLDVVDECETAWAVKNAPGGDASGAMVSLIQSLANHAHAQNPNFKIWVNSSGAEDLMTNNTFVQAIDGAYEEELFYQDNGSPQRTADTNYNLNLLGKLVSAGKPVVAIEYVSGAATIADIHAKAAAAGVGSYIANPDLELNGIDMDGVLPGQTIPVNITPPPVITGSGSDTLVLTMSEDAYKGDAQFTVSVDGRQLAGIFTATAAHAAGASQSFTFKGDWAPGAHAVAVNFLNDAYAGTAATDRNLYVNAISYDGVKTNQGAALMAGGPRSFSVTDTTAIPAAVTGSGADTLVLAISEDAYLGNAQFTVSLDGRPLGGTFTATALHSANTSQNFVFNGDFGAGAHTLAVNFINDAWAGTATTDRNLYVNAVTYGGTNTSQSAALMAGGPRTFAVSGGTTPAVSETGDHGSLQKTLSQVGSYTVGGDTFVLKSGNAAAVTLGTGASQIKFLGAGSVILTAGAGQSVVTADAGANRFTAGTGSLDVTGGGGADAYVFHASGGLLTVENFSLGDTLTVDIALQASFKQASDGHGGTMLSFGTAGHGVDIHGVAAMPSNVLWA